MSEISKKQDSVILAVDIGTTGMKMGVFRIIDNALKLAGKFSREYRVNIYNDGLFGDIEQDKWKKIKMDYRKRKKMGYR